MSEDKKSHGDRETRAPRCSRCGRTSCKCGGILKAARCTTNAGVSLFSSLVKLGFNDERRFEGAADEFNKSLSDALQSHVPNTKASVGAAKDYVISATTVVTTAVTELARATNVAVMIESNLAATILTEAIQQGGDTVRKAVDLSASYSKKAGMEFANFAANVDKCFNDEAKDKNDKEKGTDNKVKDTDGQ
jgi:hypothetical protein